MDSIKSVTSVVLSLRTLPSCTIIILFRDANNVLRSIGRDVGENELNADTCNLSFCGYKSIGYNLARDRGR